MTIFFNSADTTSMSFGIFPFSSLNFFFFSEYNEHGEIITPLLYLKEEEDEMKTMPTCMFKD